MVLTPHDANALHRVARPGRPNVRLLKEGSAPGSKLTIVVPCFNERDTILELLDRVRAVPVDKVVIVIDNCSTDGTRDRLRSACGPSVRVGHRADLPPGGPWIEGQELMDGDGFSVVLQPMNFTKAASVKLGLALARSEYFVCQDADLEYEPRDLQSLLQYAENTASPVVFGSRLSNGAAISMDAYHLGRIALTKLFGLLYGSKITDVATCYKLMRTDVARSLQLDSLGFDLDFEIPAKLRKRGISIEELPVSYHPRDRASGKKIRLRDGLSATWTLLRVWFS